MILNLGSLAFNANIKGGGGTPTWGTELGQGQGYRFNFEDSGELLTSMLYMSVEDITNVTCPLGKGGGRRDDYEFVVASLYDKIYVNGIHVKGAKFLLLIVKQVAGEYHIGRRSIKYSPRITYNGFAYNEACYKLIPQTLGISSEAAWFIDEIYTLNQDELHFVAYVLNESGEKEYQSNEERKKDFLSKINTEKESNKVTRRLSSICTSEYPLQQIFYGAPGTGKSNGIKKFFEDKNINEKEFVFRTTFHPDSDYSTFVGAYKPAMKGDKIVYTFVPQAFTNAYVKAYNSTEPVFLVIEEINRGNCAQIFGDLFQLLDRNKDGYSEYPIKASEDLRDYLLEAKDKNGNHILINKNGIANGELILPNNLYIWATMNTSDQSLFPIDSAFKRRWDWKYVPIQDGGKKWGIKVAGLEYDWWSFLEEINELIDTTTSSEDKKLGYFFCKPDDDKSVTADKFVNKVIFYLWNDVFKDYDMSDEAFKDENKGLAFGKFFKNDGNVNENVVMTFLDKLRVSLKGSYDSDEEEDMANLTQDEKNRNDSTQAEKWKNFWQLFNESDLHKRGFNSAMWYVRGIVINGTTILIELPRNSKSSHTNTIKFVAQFDQHSLPTLELPNNEDNILWIQKTTADKDRIELRLTDVNFDNLIEKANNDLFERLSKQLDEFVKFIDEKVPRSNNK